MKRAVPSGIPGLDDIISGGLARPSVVLLGGTPGTGKTIFGLQSLFNAASRGEKCLYVTTLSEPFANVIENISCFSFFKPKLLSNNIEFVDLGQPLLTGNLIDAIEVLEDEIGEILPDRILIDPINNLLFNLNEGEKRRVFFRLFNIIREWDALTVIVGEYTREQIQDDALAYLADSIFYLEQDISSGGPPKRSLSVLKMRGRATKATRCSMSIGKSGIEAIKPYGRR